MNLMVSMYLVLLFNKQSEKSITRYSHIKYILAVYVLCKWKM